VLEKKNMIVITIITEYFNQYVLELLKNRDVFNFLVGYILGIVSILCYFKVSDDKNFIKIVEFFKSILFQQQQTTTVDFTPKPTMSRALTPIRKRTPEAIEALNQSAKTKARNIWNERIVQYFDDFLDTISMTKTIKDLKVNIQNARYKIEKLKRGVERQKMVSLD